MAAGAKKKPDVSGIKIYQEWCGTRGWLRSNCDRLSMTVFPGDWKPCRVSNFARISEGPFRVQLGDGPEREASEEDTEEFRRQDPPA